MDKGEERVPLKISELREGEKLGGPTPDGTDFLHEPQASLLVQVSTAENDEGLGPRQGLGKGADRE